MRLGEIIAYAVGTVGLVAAIGAEKQIYLLDQKYHGKIHPDPPSEVARMFEINDMFRLITPSVVSREQDVNNTYHGTETSITIGDILTDPKTEMRYKGLLKEYNSLAVSSGDEFDAYNIELSEL